ncbi:MAG TPA: histidine phosphatase family protein [Candidatus Angelobacter sp.]|nr:histidine phosphatase family protein [Candidatus Angelobacter sp.]
MSHLVLVRHGQASFLEANYDKLSAKGETQARLLGEYWAKHKISFERVYSGPRARQRETARIVGETYAQAGLPWPQVDLLPTFDEFQAEAVMERALPGLLDRDASVRALHWAFEKAEGQGERFKTFQKVFEVVIGRWAAGELPLSGIEPWPDFCARVHRGLNELSQNGSLGRHIAVFSSGGPIGVAMQKALDLSTEATLRSAWMVPNCAYSEFLFSGDRFTLRSYNSHPHLIDPDFFTYR